MADYTITRIYLDEDGELGIVVTHSEDVLTYKGVVDPTEYPTLNERSSPDDPVPDEPWIWEDHHLLVLEFERNSGDPNTVDIPKLSYYHEGNNLRYLDMIIVENTTGGKEVKKIRRKAVIVSKGGG